MYVTCVRVLVVSSAPRNRDHALTPHTLHYTVVNAICMCSNDIHRSDPTYLGRGHVTMIDAKEMLRGVC